MNGVKKILLLILFFGMHCSNAMIKDKRTLTEKAASKLRQKWDPNSIISELKSSGVSNDSFVKISQGHAVDRLIGTVIDAHDTNQLCTLISTIKENKYPHCKDTEKMACTYLLAVRASTQSSTDLKQLNTTIDTLNPGQVLEDLKNGQVNYGNKADLEYRLSQCMEHFVREKKTNRLRMLIGMVQHNCERPDTAISPNQRVLGLVQNFLAVDRQESDDAEKALATIKRAFEQKK